VTDFFPLNVIGWRLCQPTLPFSSQQLYSYHSAIICSGWPTDCRHKAWAPQIVTLLSCFRAVLLLATMKRAIWRSVFSIKLLIQGSPWRDGGIEIVLCHCDWCSPFWYCTERICYPLSWLRSCLNRLYVSQSAAAAIATADVLVFVRVSFCCQKLFITIIRNGRKLRVCFFSLSL